MRYFGCSDVGKIREHNEDGYLANGIVFAVADGLGGHLAGEVASAAALQVMEEFLDETMKDERDPQQRLLQAFEAANKRVYEASLKSSSMKGMGTTLTLLLPVNGKAYIANIGDSRTYLLRNMRIKQITKDDSLVQQLVDAGKITEEQARSHPQKNVLSQALGTEHSVTPDIVVQDIRPGDIFLLASDGLTNHLEDVEILEFVDSGAAPDFTCRNLIARANERGGSDNITVVLVIFDQEI